MSEPVHISEAIDGLLPHLVALSQADGCPIDGCDNVEPAKAWVDIESGYRTSHQCSVCGHAWTCDWSD